MDPTVRDRIRSNLSDSRNGFMPDEDPACYASGLNVKNPRNTAEHGYARYYIDLKYAGLHHRKSQLFCAQDRASVVFYDFSKEAKGERSFRLRGNRG